MLPEVTLPKVTNQNQPEDSFFDTLDGESQFLKQTTKPEVIPEVEPEVNKPEEDDSFMKTMIGESQFARPAQPIKNDEKEANQIADKKVEDSFDETMPGESQFAKQFQKDDLERFFDEPTKVESPKPRIISPFKSPSTTSRNFSPTKSPGKSPELISALPPNLSPQTKKRIATEAQFRNQPKPRNLINDFSNKISSEMINSNSSSPNPARRNLTTWSANESKKPEITATSTMSPKSLRREDSGHKATRTVGQSRSDGQTEVKISKDKFGIKFKPIIPGEFDRLRKRIISNKICAMHINDGKAYFTTFTTRSDTVMDSNKINPPNVGLEPTTVGLRVQRSTD